jgi:hypothetical protein
MTRIGVMSAAFSVGMALSSGVPAQAPNPLDYVLVVHYLTDAEVAQFDGNDGQVSAFWQQNWAGRDSVVLTQSYNCFPLSNCNFSRPDDAGMVVKAGGTNQGLYLYIRIVDNLWRGSPDTLDMAYDVFEVWLDTAASARLEDSLSWAIKGDGYHVSAVSTLFAFWTGMSVQSPVFSCGCYDAGASGFPWSQEVIAVSGLAGPPGSMAVDAEWIDSTHRCHEIFLPWSAIAGCRRTGVSTLSTGQRIAFTVGYWDTDQYVYADGFYWRRVPPLFALPNSKPWADLELAEPPLGKSWQEPAAVEMLAGYRRYRPKGRAAEGYTLVGRRCAVTRMPATAGIIVLYDGLRCRFPELVWR